MKHKWYKEIQAWSEGKVIQAKHSYNPDEWEDFKFDDETPDFNSKCWQWRVKPAVTQAAFRVALMQDGELITRGWHREQVHGSIAGHAEFVKWVTDWIHYEYEVKG